MLFKVKVGVNPSVSDNDCVVERGRKALLRRLLSFLINAFFAPLGAYEMNTKKLSTTKLSDILKGIDK